MMKKISFILVLSISFLFLPLYQVFANTGGLLYGKPLLVGSNGSTPLGETDLVTDNDVTTGYTVQPMSGSNDVIDYVYYRFNENTTINAVSLNASSINNRILFYAFNGQLLRTIDNTSNTGEVVPIETIENVNVVLVSSSNTVNTLKVNEFEVFGFIEKPVTDLESTTTYNSVSLSWNNPVNDYLSNIIIKKDGVEVANLSVTENYIVTGLNPETDYNFEVFAKYSNDALSNPASISVRTDPIPSDINAPGEISDLAFGVSSVGVIFDWVNPPDTDFSHVRIYRNNQLIESSHTLNTYEDTNLIPNTTYLYKFVTVDTSGNNSIGYIQTVITAVEFDNVAPSTPVNLRLTNGSLSGFLNWDRNTEFDLLGYNIYLNGIKHNTSPVFNTNYVISNLSNEEVYTVSVSAVDTSGNESVLSDAISLEPFEGGMPVFSVGYDLSDISNGTASWFTALWPILAFSVGIVLAFIISNRVKGLIMS